MVAVVEQLGDGDYHDLQSALCAAIEVALPTVPSVLWAQVLFHVVTIIWLFTLTAVIVVILGRCVY